MYTQVHVMYIFHREFKSWKIIIMSEMDRLTLRTPRVISITFRLQCFIKERTVVTRITRKLGESWHHYSCQRNNQTSPLKIRLRMVVPKLWGSSNSIYPNFEVPVKFVLFCYQTASKNSYENMLKKQLVFMGISKTKGNNKTVKFKCVESFFLPNIRKIQLPYFHKILHFNTFNKFYCDITPSIGSKVTLTQLVSNAEKVMLLFALEVLNQVTYKFCLFEHYCKNVSMPTTFLKVN